MSDDAAVAANTIPMDEADGATAPADVVEAAPTPEEIHEASLPTLPAFEPPKEAPPPDPAKAGILSDLTRERQENKQLRQFREQAAPLLLAFQKHPDLLAEIQARELGTPRPAASAAPVPAAPPQAAVAPVAPSDEDLAQYAKDMVLYKADGSGEPDVEAARRIWQRTASETQRLVQAAIGPIQQNYQRTQAQAARESVISMAKSVGVDGPELDTVLNNFMQAEPMLMTDPSIGSLSIVVAAGMKALAGHPALNGGVGAPNGNAPVSQGSPPNGVPPGAPAPVFMERPGARAPGPPVLAPLEQRAAKARGMTPEVWGQMTAPLTNAVKGQQHIVLEED